MVSIKRQGCQQPRKKRVFLLNNISKISVFRFTPRYHVEAYRVNSAYLALCGPWCHQTCILNGNKSGFVLCLAILSLARVFFRIYHIWLCLWSCATSFSYYSFRILLLQCVCANNALCAFHISICLVRMCVTNKSDLVWVEIWLNPFKWIAR